MGKYLLCPDWGLTHHKVIFESIASSLCCKMWSPNHKKKYLLAYTLSWCILFLISHQVILAWLKKDVRDLRLFGLNIGFSINEQGVRESEVAQFPFRFRGIHLIQFSIYLFLILWPYFKCKKIKCVLGGDEVYPLFSIASQMANRYQVPVYFIKGEMGIRLFNYDTNRLSCAYDYSKFQKFYSDAPRTLFEKVENNLIERVNGIRTSLSYMPTQPDTVDMPLRILSDAVWIYLHDFYDAPGIYGKNIFRDHVDWVLKTVQYLIARGAQVVIKRHPNERPINDKIVEKLKNDLTNSVIWVDSDITLANSKKYLPKLIITVYGSVITEATYASLPVLAAGKSPYSGFDVCYEPQNIASYFMYIDQALSAQGLPPKNKSAAIKAEMAVRFYVSDYPLVPDIPYDDLSKDVWEKIFPNEYCDRNYLRRDHFLYSEELNLYITKLLSKRNLAAELGLK